MKRALALLLAAGLAACSSAGFRRPMQLDAPVLHRSPLGATFEDLVVGNGAVAVFGSLVRVHYVGRIRGGDVFDSTYDRGMPIEFTLGKAEVARGFEDALLGARVGGKRRVIVPPELGYGAKGVEGLIPPNATLELEVELLEVAGP